MTTLFFNPYVLGLFNSQATGGTITTSGSYTIHTFLTSGTFTVLSSALACDILVVAGGGGGGGSVVAGGGGGGGGVQYFVNQNVVPGPYTVTVGTGGSGGNPVATNGLNSQFGSLTASVGGGAGGSWSYTAVTGGSGGGGNGSSTFSGTPGQGNSGGAGHTQGGSNGAASAGGGGAGGNGAASVLGVGGSGGVGLANSINGTLTYYAGGGGGGCWQGDNPNYGLTLGVGSGGIGGGGGGVFPAPSNGVAATANTGGGGGGASGPTNQGTTYNGGAGGSGIVIVRYLTAAAPMYLMDYVSAIANARGLFACKRLLTAYVGPILTLSRGITNGSPTQDFYADANGNLATALTGGTTYTSWATTNSLVFAPVVKWWDQSGTGNHATAVFGSWPVYDPANNLLDFSTLAGTYGGNASGNNFMTLPNGTVPSGASPTFTITARHGKRDPAQINTIIFGGVPGNNTISMSMWNSSASPSPNAYFMNSWGTNPTTATNSVEVGNVITFAYNGSSVTQYINGVSALTTAVGLNVSSLNNSIGRVDATNGQYLNGQLNFLSIFNSVLSTVDRSIVESQGNYFDPYYYNTVLLLKGDSQISSTSTTTTFTDSSLYNAAMTGSSATISAMPSSIIYPNGNKTFGNAMYFSGTSGTAVLRTPSSAIYTFGTNNFTFEFWVYCTNPSASPRFFGNSSSYAAGAFYVYYDTGQGNRFGIASFSSGFQILSNANILPANTWTHVAFVRSGLNGYIFVNGINQTSSTANISASLDSGSGSNYLIVGDANNSTTGGFILYGYLDDVRVTNGIARYTTNFNVPFGPSSGIEIALPIATGGTVSGPVTIDGVQYMVHQFLQTGTSTFTLNQSAVCDILVVAGGGGGGGGYPVSGGGGGAGGFQYFTSQSLSAGSYTVTVGAGGTGGSNSNGLNGGNSQFGSLTASLGGGGAYGTGTSGSSGGSGGGGGSIAGLGTSGQGNSGGVGGNVSGSGVGGGGGGAGFSGTVGNSGGKGGDGLQNTITGITTYYAGGGGGGCFNYGTVTVGAGGSGGGGTGIAYGTNAIGNPGTINTGGGGGGAGANNGVPTSSVGGAGGSGIVIVRYPVGPTATIINGSIEIPALAFNTQILAGNSQLAYCTNWTFTGYCGLITATSAGANLANCGVPPVRGNQAIWCQYFGGAGTATTNLTGLTYGYQYTLGYFYARRTGNTTVNHTVKLNGNVIKIYQNAIGSDVAWTYDSYSFIATNSVMTLVITSGLTSGTDQTMIFDNFTVVADTASSLAYPPVGLTGNSTTLSGQTYGNGSYVAYSSSNYASSEGYRTFDKTQISLWSSATQSYNSNTPWATASTLYSTTVSGTAYNGEWVDILLPSSTVLTSYSLTSRTDAQWYQSPSAWLIAGSNNGGSTWALVDSQSLKPFTSASQTQTFIVSGNTTTYIQYRIIIQAVSASYQSYASIADLVLYGALSAGTSAAPTIPNASFEVLGTNPKAINLSSSGVGAMWAADTYNSNVWLPGWTASGIDANIGNGYGLGWNGTNFTPNPISGTYALLMESIYPFTMSTTITGLTPNTIYTIKGYFALKSGSPVVTVSVNGTSLLSYPVTSSMWVPKQIAFLSGPSTTATLAITNSGNQVYADNLSILAPISVAYPPAALTSNTLTTLSGQTYGNGNYVATCSSIFGTGYEAYKAFDKTTDMWHNQFSPYSATTGLYTGTTYSTTVGGTLVYGEWVDLLLPTPLILTSYSIQARGDQYYTETPAKWLIVGSNNGGSTWTIVDSRSSVASGQGLTQTFKVGPIQSYYNEYRIVIQGTSIPAGGGYTSMAEWILYGVEPLLYQLGLPFSIYNGYFGDTVNSDGRNDNVNSSVFSAANLIVSGIASNLTDINTATNNYNLNGINGGSTFSTVHYGKFLCTVTGTWTWSLNADDAAYLWLGSVADSGYTTTNTTVKYPGLHGMSGPITGTISMTAGVYYPIRIMFGQNGGGSGLQVGFTPPGGSIITNGYGYYHDVYLI